MIRNNSVLYQPLPDGGYQAIWVSDGFATLMGGTAQDALQFENPHPSASIHPEDLPAFTAALSAWESGVEDRCVTVRKQTCSGTFKWVSICFSMLEQPQGRCLYATFLDMDFVKEQEAQIALMYENLHRDLNSLSRQAAPAAPSGAAQASGEGQPHPFSAGVIPDSPENTGFTDPPGFPRPTPRQAVSPQQSHEIRTAMNTLLGLNAIALHDETLSPSVRALLEQLGDSARNLFDLIAQILGSSGMRESIPPLYDTHQYDTNPDGMNPYSANQGGANQYSTNLYDTSGRIRLIPARLEGRRILIAEDVPVNAQIMQELCRMKGMETDLAVNGQEAVSMFKQSPPGYYDAILMDVMMPVLDGLGAASAIRSMPREDARIIPIIAMTANAFDDDVQRSLSAGMDAHLSKPVEPEQLFTLLAQIIAARGG